MKYYKRCNSRLNESYGAVNDPKVIKILKSIYNDCYKKLTSSSEKSISEKYPFALFKNTVYEKVFASEIEKNESFILKLTYKSESSKYLGGRYMPNNIKTIELFLPHDADNRIFVFDAFTHEFTHMVNLIHEKINYTNYNRLEFNKEQYDALIKYVDKNGDCEILASRIGRLCQPQHMIYILSKTELNARLTQFNSICRRLFKYYNINNLNDLDRITSQLINESDENEYSTYDIDNWNNWKYSYKNVNRYIDYICYMIPFSALHLSHSGDYLNNIFADWTTILKNNLYKYKDALSLLLKLEILHHDLCKDFKPLRDPIFSITQLDNLVACNVFLNSKLNVESSYATNNNSGNRAVINLMYYVAFYTLKGFNNLHRMKFNMKYKYDKDTLLKMCLDNELAETVRQKCGIATDHIVKEFLYKMYKIIYMNLNK